jgi:archaellum component FlaG (FlaF/FlaG flagellin family)
MSDNAISTGIMSTASIITTVVIVAAAFTVAAAVGASINNGGQNLADQINTDYNIISMGDIQEGNSTVYCYIKNRGMESINSFSLIEVFVDGNYYYLDSLDSDQYRWNATILNDNGNSLWETQETIVIRLYYPTGETISAGSHKVTVSISGNTEKFSFSV